jgi:hypothetical protein
VEWVGVIVLVAAFGLMLAALWYDSAAFLLIRRESEGAAGIRERGRRQLSQGLMLLSIATAMGTAIAGIWLSNDPHMDLLMIRDSRFASGAVALLLPFIVWHAIQKILTGRALLRSADRAARG